MTDLTPVATETAWLVPLLPFYFVGVCVWAAWAWFCDWRRA